MSEPQPSRNDPSPEERKGDSSFLPVVIAAAVAIIVILVLALIILKAREGKSIPATKDQHPTSQVMPSPQPVAVRVQSTIAA